MSTLAAPWRHTQAGSRSRTVVAAAGIVGGMGWLSKIAIMAVQGGPDAQSVPEAIAFCAGAAGVLTAAAAGGAFLARKSHLPTRILAAAGLAVLVIAAIGLGQAALTALPGDSWLQAEAIFGIAGVAAIAAGVAMVRRPEN